MSGLEGVEVEEGEDSILEVVVVVVVAVHSRLVDRGRWLGIRNRTS